MKTYRSSQWTLLKYRSYIVYKAAILLFLNGFPKLENEAEERTSPCNVSNLHIQNNTLGNQNTSFCHTPMPHLDFPRHKKRRQEIQYGGSIESRT